MSLIVKEEGHSPYLAKNGLEAIRNYKRIKPDLVLLDLKMPVMNGISALKEMLRVDHRSNFVVITAYAEIESINEINDHVLKWIFKPFNIDELRETIRQVAEHNGAAS